MQNTPTAAAAFLAAFAATVQADIVNMHYTGLGSGHRVQINAGDRALSTFAGQLIHNVTSADEGWRLGIGAQPFFCTDLYQNTSSSVKPYTLSGLNEVPDSQPMSAQTALAVKSLFAAAGQAQFDGDAPDDLAAAFQLALWEVVSDYDSDLGRSSLDIESGWFSARNAGGGTLSVGLQDRLGTFFDAVADGERFQGEIFALRSSSAQDQLASIPTSGSIASLCLGLALAYGRRGRDA